jgi:hypothetical protein
MSSGGRPWVRGPAGLGSAGNHYPDGAEPDACAYREVLGDAVGALDAAGFDHLLMGGAGAAAQARPRTTDDIDLFVRAEDAVAALEALAAVGFDTEQTDPMWLFKARRNGVLVDVIFRSSGDVYVDDEMVARAAETTYKA